jgi:hypothetical protein
LKIIKKKKETTKMTKNKIEYDGYSIEEKKGERGYAYRIADGNKTKAVHMFPNELTDEEADNVLKDFFDRINAKVTLIVEHKGATLTQNEKTYTKVFITNPDGSTTGMDGVFNEVLTEESAKRIIEDFLAAYEERKKAAESAK